MRGQKPTRREWSVTVLEYIVMGIIASGVTIYYTLNPVNPNDQMERILRVAPSFFVLLWVGILPFAHLSFIYELKSQPIE